MGMFNIYDEMAKTQASPQATGMAYAKLAPGRGSVALAGQGGQMMAQGAMGAMGMKTPAQQRNEGIMAVRQQFPDPKTASEFMSMGNALNSIGESDMAKQAFDAAKSLQTTSKAPPVFRQKIQDINALDIPQAEKDAMIKKVLSGDGGTTINMGAGDTAYDKEAGKIAAKTDKDLVDLATITATASLDKTGEVLDILETGEASTGMFAGLDLVKNRFLSVFGNEEARKSATKTQVLEAFLGSDVFPMIKALGIGARGLDTPAEREFLINVMTGAKEMNKEAIIKLTELRRSINESVVEKYNKRLADGGLDRFQKAYGRPLEPIKLKFRPPSSAISGVINGTKVFKLTNGEYVDAYGKPFKLNKGK